MLTHQVWMPEGGVVIEVCPSLEQSCEIGEKGKKEKGEKMLT